MIREKEYPATHSMSTAWYMVDADGNVGLMEFQDNGPVPEYNHVEYELSLIDLIFGQGFSNDEKCKGIHLTEPQICELLGEPRRPDEVECWFDVCLAIYPDRTEEFLALCKNNDVENYGCISPDMNLYCVDVFDCKEPDSDEIIKDSTFDKMFRTGIIRAIYQVPQMEVNDDYNPKTKSVEFTKTFDNSPYYIYCQSYWTGTPQHRMNIPSNPVKLTQIDEKYRKRLLHIPIRFKDKEDIQIAQWFVCNAYGKAVVIDNAGYIDFPVDKQTGKYCLTRPFLFDFYDYCPEMGYFKCKKCNLDCGSTLRSISSLTPTVLFLVAPTRKHLDLEKLVLPQNVTERMAAFSYIPKFPHKKPGSWIYEIDQVKEFMTKEVLSSLLSYSRGWFENVVRTINPQVLIIDDEALDVFGSVFPIADNKIEINDSSYPIFKESAVKDNQERIIALAKAPYRGKKFHMTYTEQEVEDLKRQGKAFDIDY